MNDLEKKIKKRFIALLISSALFVAAIPMIVVGFVNGWLFVAIPSIVVAVAGFYGLPIGWASLSNLILSKNFVRAITDDGITKIVDLAANFGKKQNTVKKEISEILRKRYLTGYKFNEDGTELEKIQKTEPEKKVRADICVFCGAGLPSDGGGVCQYCGAAYRIE
jgi:hypothetical protein